MKFVVFQENFAPPRKNGEANRLKKFIIWAVYPSLGRLAAATD